MMMNNYLILDIETDDINATRIWVVCSEDYKTGDKQQFLNIDTIPEERDRFLDYLKGYNKFVFHNGIGFDVPVINKILGLEAIRLDDVVDTLILSRLIDFGIQGGHSLRAWGQRLGDFKLDFKGFEVLTQEMVDYCHQDVTVTKKLFSKFIKTYEDQAWQDSIKCEHEIQMLCEDMTNNGFYFDEASANQMLDEIELRLYELEEGFQQDFPPTMEEVNRIQFRVKSDGSVYTNVSKARDKYPMTKIDNSTTPNQLVCYDLVPFKPSSPKQRIDRLWEAGWTPYEKTKGHIDHDREVKQAKRPRGAWR